MNEQHKRKLLDALGVEPIPLVVIVPAHVKGGDTKSPASKLFGATAGEMCTNTTAIIKGSNVFASESLKGTLQLANCEICDAPFDVDIPAD